jgi:hypothetical protein
MVAWEFRLVKGKRGKVNGGSIATYLPDARFLSIMLELCWRLRDRGWSNSAPGMGVRTK